MHKLVTPILALIALLPATLLVSCGVRSGVPFVSEKGVWIIVASIVSVVSGAGAFALLRKGAAFITAKRSTIAGLKPLDYVRVSGVGRCPAERAQVAPHTKQACIYYHNHMQRPILGGNLVSDTYDTKRANVFVLEDSTGQVEILTLNASVLARETMRTGPGPIQDLFFRLFLKTVYVGDTLTTIGNGDTVTVVGTVSTVQGKPRISSPGMGQVMLISNLAPSRLFVQVGAMGIGLLLFSIISAILAASYSL